MGVFILTLWTQVCLNGKKIIAMKFNSDEEIDRLLDEFFSNISVDQLKEIEKKISAMNIGGPTVEKYFLVLKNIHSLNKRSVYSGKLEQNETMDFFRNGFRARKLVDNQFLGFNLVSVTNPIDHPKKEVKEGIRIYRVEQGSGVFEIFFQNGKYEKLNVTSEDVVFIVRGDSYSYSMTPDSRMFEVNIMGF